MTGKVNISPAQRNQLFNSSTRRNIHPVNTQVGAESGIVSFNIPKTRLLSKLYLDISATLTATHAQNNTYTPHEDAPCNFVRRVEVNLNNGFSPFSISGQALDILNMTELKVPVMTTSVTDGRFRKVQEVVASAQGTANDVRIFLEMPIQINPRDAIGLLLAQNEETLITCNVTLGTVADLAPAAGGYTFALSAISVSLYTDTFSVPALKEAFPDISILKLVNEKTESLIAGENIIRIPVGQTIRKLGFICYTAVPARIADAIITSPIELILNQADIPYRVTPRQIALENSKDYEGALGNGIYVFDFASGQGLNNLAGARDYIDTERITEFWLKFTTSVAGTCRVFYETLSKLRME